MPAFVTLSVRWMGVGARCNQVTCLGFVGVRLGSDWCALCAVAGALPDHVAAFMSSLHRQFKDLHSPPSAALPRPSMHAACMPPDLAAAHLASTAAALQRGVPPPAGAAGMACTPRQAAVARYLEKKKQRTFRKKVRYESRKKLAESRPRVRGQFVRQDVAAATALMAASASPHTHDSSRQADKDKESDGDNQVELLLQAAAASDNESNGGGYSTDEEEEAAAMLLAVSGQLPTAAESRKRKRRLSMKAREAHD